MSWLRTAVNKAVEVGNKNNITRTVKNYADSVVLHAGHAVAEGAKLLQDRIGNRNYKSIKQTIRRLEEAAISCRGAERAMLLARWLAVLKEIDRLSGSSTENKDKKHDQHVPTDEAKRPSLVLYYDPDAGGEVLNFREVFLQSQALEGIVLSMILEVPSGEEISLLLEIFGYCLRGGKEVHNAIVNSIQDLATVFSSYQDEVLVKREELLQFAQGAVTGLKINGEILRIDTEASNLKEKLDQMAASSKPSNDSHDGASEDSVIEIEALKGALAQIRVCSRLEALLLKKQALTNGDSVEIHAQKVDKLKILSQSLASSTDKAGKRISEHRDQKEEALKVRVTKASEASEKEKELAAEISQLESQRDELEAELKKVNISLAAANARFRDAREERDQFDEANNKIVAHLKSKEDELSKSTAACKIEAEVLSTWLKFLEETWQLQCTYTEIKDKQVIDELERHEDYFVNATIGFLCTYKEVLGPSIGRIGKFVENLKNLSVRSEIASDVAPESTQLIDPRKDLEKEYLDYEAKIITTFSVVDNMKEHFYAQQGKIPRKDDPRINELFDDIEKLRGEFESIERPELEMEISSPRSDNLSPKANTPSPRAETRSFNTSTLSKEKPTSPKLPNVSENIKTNDGSEASSAGAAQVLDPQKTELAELESAFGIAVDLEVDTRAEVGSWEFDELEEEFNYGDLSAKHK